MQEEEERLKPSTKKGIVFRVLRSVGSAGMEIAQIVEAAQQHSEWARVEADKKVIAKVLKNILNPCFYMHALCWSVRKAQLMKSPAFVFAGAL